MPWRSSRRRCRAADRILHSRLSWQLEGEASQSTGDGNDLAEIELGLIAEPAQ